MPALYPHRLNLETEAAIKRRAAKLISEFMPFCGSHAKAKKAAEKCANELRSQFDKEFAKYCSMQDWEYEEKNLMFDYLIKAIRQF